MCMGVYSSLTKAYSITPLSPAYMNNSNLDIHVHDECKMCGYMCFKLFISQRFALGPSAWGLGFGKLFPKNHLLFYSFILRY